MNIIIRNNTNFSFSAVCEENAYQLTDKNTVAIFSPLDETTILFEIQKKDSVAIDVLDIILGMFLGDSTTTKVYCDSIIKVKKLNDENITIVLNENLWHPREQADFLSACATSENGEITDLHFNAKNIEKTRKKHKRLHLFVTSLLPVGIILFLGFLIFCYELTAASLFILFFFFWFIIFGYPSVKEIKRFKELSDPNFINEKMLEHSKYRREHGTDFYDDNSKTGKIISKILDKMFKPNGEE